MVKDVKAFIGDCARCDVKQASKVKPPLTPIVASSLRDRCIFDLTELPIDTKTGARYILVVINAFSKFVWTFALTEKTVRWDDTIETMFMTRTNSFCF